MDCKITVKLPDTLRRRAKAVAALRGETVSDVVRDALEAYIAESMEEAEDVRAADEVEARLLAGTESIHDHEAVWREIASREESPASSGMNRPIARRTASS